MKKKLALIFGHRGGIGTATKVLFQKNNYFICPVDRNLINFENSKADLEIQTMLTNVKADVVVNCAGNFINGYKHSHADSMNVNFGSNWSLIKYYDTHRDKPVRIIMIGSSCYNQGRKLYPLYSASKAALYNLWESSRDHFEGSNITVDLINPVRTLTAMSSKGKQVNPELDYLKPEQVAEQIFKMVDENLPARCINMTFEDAK
jgi:short-subunit dehydrogenase